MNYDSNEGALSHKEAIAGIWYCILSHEGTGTILFTQYRAV